MNKKKRIPHNKLTYGEVKDFIESNSDCKVLSTEYINSITKLKVECGCTNIFHVSYIKFKHRNKRQCNECSGYKEYTYEEVKNMIEVDYNLKLLSSRSDFKNLNSRISVECECGNPFETPAYVFHRKEGKTSCNECTGYKVWTYEDVCEWYESFGSKVLTPKCEYKNTRTTIDIECKCGEKFSGKPQIHTAKDKNKHLCGKCNGHYVYNFYEVKDEVESFNGNILLSEPSIYKTTRTKLDIECGICGEMFKRDFTDYKRSKHKACPECSLKLLGESRRYSQEYVEKFVNDNGCELISEYIKSNLPIDIRCACGEKFTTIFNEFNNGYKRQCDKCSGKMSKGEKFLSEWFELKEIEFEPQKKFSDCKYKAELPFDFYIPDLNTVIEVDGFLHYEFNEYFHKTQENFELCKLRDKIKNQYCIDNNINLIRIKYKTVRDIENWVDTDGYKLMGVMSNG